MPERTPLHDAASKAGAVFLEEAGWLVPARFRTVLEEYQRCRDHAAVFDESHRGKLELRGPDARSFLHRLSSNDIAGLPADGGCEAFLATAKAKVVAHLLAFPVRDPEGVEAIWLDLAPGQAAKTLQHLDHFLISEQLELLDRTRDFAQIHLAGPRAKAILESALSTALPDLRPLQHVELPRTGGTTLHIRRHDPLGLPGFDLLVPSAAAKELWNALLAQGAVPAGQETFHTLRIEAGTPIYGVDIDENNLAMEINRTAQAISYTKGCFPGQEPIVRARDLGHVNWSLRGLKIEDTGPIPTESKLCQEGKAVGRITSAAISPRFGCMVALGYVRRGHDAPGMKLEVALDGGQRMAEVASLPFSD
jgi:folate-binding protein YgfZ